MIEYFCPEDCQEFAELIQGFPELTFFQPSPDVAPWHVQAILPIQDDEPIVLNFWPHKVKGARQPFKSVEGVDAIRTLITDAIKDATAEPFGVFEDYQT